MQPLVRADELAERLAAGTAIAADVRWYLDGRSGHGAYESGHIPGAVFVDVETALAGRSGPVVRSAGRSGPVVRSAGRSGPGRHPLPTPAAFARAMSKLGIGDDDLVVAYDDAAGSIAARLWWMLRATGHAAAVLDGGIAAWNGDVEVGAGAMRPPRTFTPTSWPAHDVVDAHEVVALRNQGAVLVDARDAARYRGELEPIDPRAGHIPGARSAPWRGNIDPTSGQFRDTRELRERFGALGIDDASTVVAYCGSGITACHAILALEMAGLPAARLYEGSWSDWCSDPSRPAATGDESD